MGSLFQLSEFFLVDEKDGTKAAGGHTSNIKDLHTTIYVGAFDRVHLLNKDARLGPPSNPVWAHSAFFITAKTVVHGIQQ